MKVYVLMRTNGSSHDYSSQPIAVYVEETAALKAAIIAQREINEWMRQLANLQVSFAYATSTESNPIRMLPVKPNSLTIDTTLVFIEKGITYSVQPATFRWEEV